MMISGDKTGNIEYWETKEPFLFPKKKLNFEFKTETSLYHFRQRKTGILALAIGPKGKYFATISADLKVAVWDFMKAKILTEFDETISFYEKIQIQSGQEVPEEGNFLLESFDFGQRAARETKRKIENSPNLLFDDSGNFLIYATLVGIKIVELANFKVVSLLGKDESSDRFLKLSLSPMISVDLNMPAVRAFRKPLSLTRNANIDTLFNAQKLLCTSFTKHRIYLWSRTEPPEETENTPQNNNTNTNKTTENTKNKSDKSTKNSKNNNSKINSNRDFQNETKPPSASKSLKGKKPKDLSRSVLLKTTMGDIHLQLFPEQCPKTVENFVGLVQKNYYDRVIFHRVVRNFIVQSGDPTGTGRGGKSIWGKEFEDEIRAELRHDNPGVLSMANMGPRTNGSQFFITLRKAPFLDGKHTVFGSVVKGMDVVFKIGELRVDKYDRPEDPPEIVGAVVLD